jgi:hypothetical protein
MISVSVAGQNLPLLLKPLIAATALMDLVPLGA